MKSAKSTKGMKGVRKAVFLERGFLVPLSMLALMLALSLWHGRTLSDNTRRWEAQTERVEVLARRGDWSGAEAALSGGYQDWASARTYLRVFCRHDAVEPAEALYRRCAALVREEDADALIPELVSLREQLEALSDMERLSPGNLF